MAQAVAIVTKNSGNQLAIMTPSQEDGLIVPLTPIVTPCDLEQNFENNLLPLVTNPEVEAKLPIGHVIFLAFL